MGSRWRKVGFPDPWLVIYPPDLSSIVDCSMTDASKGFTRPRQLRRNAMKGGRWTSRSELNF